MVARAPSHPWFVLLLLVVLASLGCGRKQQRAETRPATNLSVLTTIPQGDIEGRASVDVIFDRPVVAMGASDPSLERGRQVLTLDPEPKGYYHWVGTRALTFVVNEGVPYATHFTARVSKGLRAVDGTALDREVGWEFTTPRPRLLASVPAPQDSLIRPEDPFYLAFNQPVDPVVNAPALELEGGPKVEVSRPDSALLAAAGWSHLGRNPDRLVLVRPQAPLQHDHAYVLHIKPSLRGTSGPLPMDADVRIPFRTYGVPGVVSVTGTGGASIVFRTPVDPDSLRRYLQLVPPPASLWVGGSGTELRVGGLEPSTEYRMTVARGLPDLFGQKLTEKKTATFRTWRRYPGVQILPEGNWGETAIVPLASERQVVLRYVSLTELQIRVEPLTPEMEVRLRSASRDSIFRAGVFTMLYQGRADDAWVTRTVPVDRLVPAGRPGAVLVVAKGHGIGSNGHTDVARMAVIRWSDLGLTVKGAPTEGLAWATSLGSAEPRTEVRFTALNDLGRALWNGTGDTNGITLLPGRRSQDRATASGRELPNYTFVKAVSGDDVALGRVEGNDRLSPWQFGMPAADLSATDHRAFVYSDRDLYRPGETVHLSGLVRRLIPSGLGEATIDSIRVIVQDPQGAPRADSTLVLDRLGGLALDLPLRAEAPTGSYWINVVLPGPTRAPEKGEGENEGGLQLRLSIGSGAFTVAAYRAPSFQVKVRTLQRTVTAGDRFRAEVKADYFFGTPVAGARLSWTLVRDRTGIQPAGYEAFSFGDPEGAGPQGAVLASGETALDAEGRASVQVMLPQAPFESFERLTFEAGVQDPTGDTVHGRTRVTYSPASVAPGVGLPDRIIGTDTPVEIRLVALRADTALAASGTPLHLTLVRREWRSIRKLLVGGRIGYENAVQDSVLGTRDIVSSREPSRVTWDVHEPGSYRLIADARDSQGRRARAVGSFYVAGKRRQGPLAAWEDDPILSVTLDKKAYRVGETARVLVSTPVHARRAILSVERESVIESRLVDLGTGSMVFDVPVKASYLPNVYVGVTLVEPELSPSEAPNLPAKARLPRVRIGYAQLTVDVTSRRLGVTAIPDRAEYRPGDAAALNLSVRTAAGSGAPARVSVAVVDEAVLALLGTANPDPFSFFYAMRGLGVRTDDTRLDLRLGGEAQLEGEKGEAGGGGEEEGPEVRSDFLPVAYWNPAVFTDATGHARVTFKLPDNLTRFRVIAVAASEAEFFGTGEGTLLVTQPLTLDPALPRFVLQGDAFLAAVLVTNRTHHSLHGTVAMDTNLGGHRKSAPVELAPDQSRRIAFPLQAETVGEARVGFRAEFAGIHDAVERPLPVLEPRTSRTAAAAGRTDSSATEAIDLPPNAIPGSGMLDLSVSPSVLAGAEHAFRYVLEYPHGCLEQESSRLLAIALYTRLTRSMRINWADSLMLDAKLRETIARMRSLASSSESFSFWPGETSEAPPGLSAYAAYALAEAKRSGAPVPEDLLEKSAELTQRWLRGLSLKAKLAPAREANVSLPVGLLLLTATELDGLVPQPMLQGLEIDAFLNMSEKLSAEDRVFLALAAHRMGRREDFVERVLAETKNRVQISAAGAVVAADTGSPVPPPMRTGVRATALTLLLIVRAHETDPLCGQLAFGLLGLSKGGEWGSTQDNLLALLALVNYREQVEDPVGLRKVGLMSVGPRDAALVSMAGGSQPLLSHDFPDHPVEAFQRHAVLPESVRPGAPVTLKFERQSNHRGTLYYGAVLRWDEPALNRPPEEGGYSLLRRIEPLEGSGPPRLGDLVTITLEIVVPRESWYLAVRDPLPGGLEIVHSEFAVESELEAQQASRYRGRYERLPVTYTDVRDRELRAYADHVAPGVFEFRYLARVRALGEFGHPPATVEAMYAPELNAASGSPPWRTSR
jgi:alpha-2-macroglobulin